MGAERFRYKAFISYSHRDQVIAQWLHRALEAYRVPKHLIGRETACGAIQKKLGPLFRDRDELPVAADLSGQINEALAATQFLIVLCSPASAQSKWVSQEIINFKRMKGTASIIAVIVDGEPYASGMPGREHLECFAPALRFQVSQDGYITEQPAEPIAADLRPGKDGKQMVKLKILAGLLGVGLDELVQRETLRRQRFMTAVTFASLAGIGVMGALTFNAIAARNEAEIAQSNAERRRGEAEELIEFMLTDLQVPLREIGRLKEFNSVSEKVLNYYKNENLSELPDDSLGRRARAFHLVGESRLQARDFASAQQALQNAHDATRELLERSPQASQRLYEHGQSEFWLGNLAFQNGYFEEAAKHIEAYANIADTLLSQEPDHPQRLMSAARAKISLGAVLTKSGQPLAAHSWFERAQGTLEKLMTLEQSGQPIQEMGNLLAGKADVLRTLGRMSEAVAAQQRSRELNEQIFYLNNDDRDARWRLAISERRLGRLLFETGQHELAHTLLDSARQHMDMLLKIDPNVRPWQDEFTASTTDFALLSMFISSPGRSDAIFNFSTMERFFSKEQPGSTYNLYWQSRVNAKNILTWQKIRSGDLVKAKQAIEENIRLLDSFDHSSSSIATLTTAKVETLVLYSEAYANNKQEANASYVKARTLLSSLNASLTPETKYVSAALSCRLGEESRFNQLKAELKEMGFVSPLSIISILFPPSAIKCPPLGTRSEL